MKLVITIALIILTHSVGYAQVRDTNIKFILPPNVDSVASELFKSIEEAGLIDSFIVEWILHEEGFDKYAFHRIPNSPEFDTNGQIQNQELWLKKRTNRVLKVGSQYEIPLVHRNDMWAYTRPDVRPYVSFDLGRDQTMYLRYDHRVFPVVDIWASWKFGTYEGKRVIIFEHNKVEVESRRSN